jgi:mRNA interferase RelE/StbE
LADFKIFETNGFLKDLQRDFSGQKERVYAKLLNFIYPQLRHNPYYGKNIKKLRDYSPATWRYRLGDYRFLYAIDDKNKLVMLIAADNRKDIY